MRVLWFFGALVLWCLGGLILTLAAQEGVGPELAPIKFDDVAAEAGLDFVLENNPTPEKHIIETMPGGLAVFDYNGDGLPDIFFTNGAALLSLEKSTLRHFNRLYRNEGGMKFTDLTEAAGVAGAGYSMGAAAADYDNDGHVDLFVAGVFRNLLYRNNGDGTFEELSEQAGIKSDLWGVAGGWFDYDRDGLLDLFVVNYAEWSTSYQRFCGDRDEGVRVYCHPKYYNPVRNALYRNRGDGSFEDVTQKAGIAPHKGRGMSVAFNDYDGDGLIDAFVTNDNLPNFLFRNQGDGSFEEVALVTGVALREHGKPVASMGVDFRDYDNDGKPDINVTALAGETFPLFRNQGESFFQDATYSSRLARLTMGFSAWGNGFFDFNNDGWKDLFTANSHVNDLIELFEATEYKQRNSVFANLGNGTFEDVSAGVSEEFQTARAHRGSAFADFNGDGKIDIVVTSLSEPTELWQNISPESNNWVILDLEGSRSNRDGIGARVRIGSQYNIMTTAVGYASSSYSGVHFGLGETAVIDRIAIRWPSGTVQVLENIAANQVLHIREPESR